MTTQTHRTRIMWITTALAVLAMVAMALAMAPGRAHAADKGATTLTMAEPKSGPSNTLLLSAKLTGPDGKPVANARVEFLFKVDVLGQTQALLGTVPTTVAGSATYVYRLQQNGPVDFFARFNGDANLAGAASQAIHFDVTGAPAPAQAEGTRVGVVGQWVPWAALALVLSVWVTLIGVAVRTVVAIPSAARGFIPEPGAEGDLATQWRTVSDLETN
jgi:hypothetical protein